MKIKMVLTEEEKISLADIATIDVCKDIDCSAFPGCDGCPLVELTKAKEELDKKIYAVIHEN